MSQVSHKQDWVVTGGSRGIGLELIKGLLAAGRSVTVWARRLDQADRLRGLRAEHPGDLTLMEVDVTNDDQIAAAAAEMKDRVLHGLINNAGILLDEDGGLQGLRFEDLNKTLAVNTVAPMRVTQALIKNLALSDHPKIINISSLMGSIEDNSRGGSYSYRISKTAINMFTKCLAMERPDWTVLSLHPGWVQTDMGGPRAKTSPVDSAQGLLRVIDQATPEQSGEFFDYQGKELPW